MKWRNPRWTLESIVKYIPLLASKLSLLLSERPWNIEIFWQIQYQNIMKYWTVKYCEMLLSCHQSCLFYFLKLHHFQSSHSEKERETLSYTMNNVLPKKISDSWERILQLIISQCCKCAWWQKAKMFPILSDTKVKKGNYLRPILWIPIRVNVELSLIKHNIRSNLHLW